MRMPAPPAPMNRLSGLSKKRLQPKLHLVRQIFSQRALARCGS